MARKPGRTRPRLRVSHERVRGAIVLNAVTCLDINARRTVDDQALIDSKYAAVLGQPGTGRLYTASGNGQRTDIVPIEYGRAS